MTDNVATFTKIKEAFNDAYKAKGRKGVKELLLTPSDSFNGTPTEFIKKIDHFYELDYALDTYEYSEWVGPAAAVIAVCVPHYDKNLFIYDDGKLIPTHSGANDLLKV